VVSKADDNNRNDSDVLRAADVVPPFGAHGRRKQSQGTPQATSGKNAPLKQSSATEKPVEIPRLDLAEGLMVGQRTVSSSRRKSPGRKTGRADSDKPAPAVEDKYTPIPQPSEQQLLIAAIVARDIERFCRGQVTLAVE
jgi:hypothetical protein